MVINILASTRPLTRAAPAFVLFLWLLSSTGLAQDHDATESAAARALFEQGVAFADQDAWDDAADRFQRALDMRYSSVIAFNLSTALEALGRVVEAEEVLRQASRRSDATPEVREAARAALERLAPRVSHLTVHVTGESAGATVTLDDRELPPPMWGVPAPVDAGDHRVVAERGEEILARQAITVAEGGSAEVSLELPDIPSPEAVAAGALEVEPEIEPESSGVLSSPWFWVIVGVLVAGGVVTGALLATRGETEPIFQGSFPTIPIGAAQ